MPERVQRQRKKGWVKPANTVYVGRGSDWGNPFKTPLNSPIGRAYVVAQFAEYCNPDSPLAEAARRILRGKNLMCWCPLDQPCHADFLLTISNTERT